MTKKRGKNINDMDAFLASKQASLESEPGHFTLNQERALETLLDSLRLEPEGFCRHILVAAHLSGATSVEYSVPRKLSSYGLTGSYALSLKFDGEPLCPEELDKIAMPETLLGNDERLRRFSLAYHQAAALGSPWMRLSVWDVDTLTVLTVDRGNQNQKTRRPNSIRKHRRGTFVEFRLPRILFHMSRGPVMAKKLAASRIYFESSTRWSPLKAKLNKTLLPQSLPPQDAIGYTVWSESKTSAWLEPSQNNTAIIPIWCGLTLEEIRVNPKEWDLPTVPGLRVAFACDELPLEPTGLRPVQGPIFQKVVDNALRRAHSLLDELAQEKSQEARTYFLSNWSRLQHLPLATYLLFKTLEGDYRDLQSLQERRATREEIIQQLTPEDAPYALRLLQVSHFYRFYRGAPPPDIETLHPAGIWVSMLRGKWLSFSPLQSPRDSHRCPLPQLSSSHSWHPTEPWYAFQSQSELIVWDLKLERVWHRRKGQFRHFEFSPYGRYLYLFEKVAASRIRVSRLQCDDFSQPAITVQAPGNKPTVVGSLLLLWLNPLCFHVLRLPDLDKRLDHFTTREELTTLLDCSPCGQYALLGGPKSTYLLQTEELTLKRLPVVLKVGLFSWHSDYIFARDEVQPLVLHLETLEVTKLAQRIIHFSRSGRTLEESTELQELPLQLKPGLRVFDRVRLQSRNLIHPAQSSRGRRSRDLELLRTSGKNFCHTLAVSEQQPPKLFRTHGQIQAEIFVSPKSGSFLSTPTPGGTRFQGLTGQATEFSEIPGVSLFRETLVKVQNTRVLLLNGFDTKSVIASVPLCDLEELKVLGSYLCYRDGETRRVIDRATGSIHYQSGLPVIERNTQWRLSIATNGMPAFADIGASELFWVLTPEYERLHLHPKKNLVLAESDGFSSLARLGPSGIATLEDTRRCGTGGQFSPDGEHYFLIHDEQLTIHRTSGADKLKSLPIASENSTVPRWLDNHFLQIGQQIWWRTESDDWSKCRLTKWEFPSSLQQIPGTQLCLIPNDSEFQFLNLANGRLVATYRPLADHWFAFTPEGFWDGSDGCLEYIRPWPKKPPKRNLLRTIAQQFAYS